MDAMLQRCTPKQRLALHYVAKGLRPAEVADSAHSTIGSLELWRASVHGYKDAWYTLVAQAGNLGVEAVHAAAVGDALLHYEAINELAAMVPDSAADRTVKLAANKETLTLAGAYRGTVDSTVSFGDVLVQIANMGNAPLGGLPPPEPTEPVALAPAEQREAATEGRLESVEPSA